MQEGVMIYPVGSMIAVQMEEKRCMALNKGISSAGLCRVHETDDKVLVMEKECGDICLHKS